MAKSPAIPKPLKDATRGLLFPSETDAPFEAFAWPAGPVTAAGILTATSSPPKTKVEELSLTDFFRAVPRDLRGSYHDLLVAIADQLSGAKVFKVGETRMTAYIVGTTADGHRAGVKTEIVET